MPFEKSAGAVIYHRHSGKLLYLLLHYPSSTKANKAYWDFPKGHVEAGEQEQETVIREVKEETGLTDLRFELDFNEWIKYFFQIEGKKIFKLVIFFLAETAASKITISSEHCGFVWLAYDQALKRLSFKNAKQVLTKANAFLAAEK